MATTVAELARTPSAQKSSDLLFKLGDLIPAHIRAEIQRKARDCDALKKRHKEYRQFMKIKSTLSALNDICEVDVPEVGPAYNELAKLFRTIGEMEIS